MKTVSELTVEHKGTTQKEDGAEDNNKGGSSSNTEPKEEAKHTQNGNSTNGTIKDVKAGDKRKADESATKENGKPGAVHDEPDAKKQKTANGNAATDEKKKPGRPKGANGAKKEKKAPRVGTAARKTRSQGKAE